MIGEQDREGEKVLSRRHGKRPHSGTSRSCRMAVIPLLLEPPQSVTRLGLDNCRSRDEKFLPSGVGAVKLLFRVHKLPAAIKLGKGQGAMGLGKGIIQFQGSSGGGDGGFGHYQRKLHLYSDRESVGRLDTHNNLYRNDQRRRGRPKLPGGMEKWEAFLLSASPCPRVLRRAI
jgi:hypothetical protein